MKLNYMILVIKSYLLSIHKTIIETLFFQKSTLIRRVRIFISNRYIKKVPWEAKYEEYSVFTTGYNATGN